LNAYPLPNGPEVLDANGNHQGVAQFNASYSNPGSLYAYSLRIDHKVSDKLTVFGRFNYSPSSFDFRGFTSALSTVTPTEINTMTATIGATWAITPNRVNDFRFNYSRVDGSSTFKMDNFGGATPLTTVPYPSPFTSQNGFIRFSVGSLGSGTGSDILTGADTFNQQRQFNVVDSVTMQSGSHSLKFGVDYRRLHPLSASSADSSAPVYGLGVFFSDIPSAETGAALFQGPQVTLPVTLLFHNLGAFAQDTWRINPRLTMTYGLRWDVDFVPSTTNGPEFNAVTLKSGAFAALKV
jgi:outer membrane receptor protein involved in Fe transport